MRKYIKMKLQRIVVVSECPMFREGLKRLIEEAGVPAVVTASDNESIRSLVVEAAPDVVVVARLDTSANGLVYFLQRQEKPTKVIVVGWDDDKLAVYSRLPLLPATLKNFIEVLRKD